MIAPYFRLDHFERELPPGGPAHWSLDRLDQAREAILRDIDDRLMHLQAARHLVLNRGRGTPDDLASPARSVFHWQYVNTWEALRRYRYGMPDAAAACYCALARRLIGCGEWETAGQALERVLRCNPMSREVQACLDALADAGGTAIVARLRDRYHLVFVGSFGQDRLKLPLRVLPLPERREVAVTTQRAPGVYFFSLTGRFKRFIYLKLRAPLGLEAAEDGTLWVCDQRNARLVHFHPHTGFLEALPVRSQAPRFEPLYPVQTRMLGGNRFACLVSTQAQDQSFTGILTADGFCPFATKQRLPFSLACHGQQVFSREFFDGSIECHDVRGTPAEAAFDMPLLPENYTMTRGKDAWFMDASGRSLAKFSPEGKRVFLQPIDTLLDFDGLILHMHTCRYGKRELLYCVNLGTNSTNGSILVFEVAGPSPDRPA